MATLVSDLAWDDSKTAEEAVSEAIAGLEVTAKILKEHGPGGGWPEVEFTGSRPALEKLAIWYTHNSKDPGLRDMIESITD